MIKKTNSSNSDTVVQHNTLVEATHQLNKNEILAFKKIISMIDTKYRDRELQIPKRDVINFLFPKLKNKENIQTDYYEKAKKYCEKLMETNLKFREEGKYGKFTLYSVCSKLEWPYNDNYVNIEFSDRIMPFIFELKKCFTQYPIGMLQKIKSKNAIRIYEYCRMNLHSQKEKYTWNIPLEDFKRILDLENKYPRFNTLRQEVLDKRIPEINEKTDIHIECEPVMQFGSVVELVFTVKEKFPKTVKELANNKKLWNEQPSRVATGESRQISY